MSYKECLEFLKLIIFLQESVDNFGAIKEATNDYIYKKVPKTHFSVYKWSSGDKYIGSMVNNKFEGKGVYFFNNGNLRVGTWKNNNLNGKAILFYPDNTCQKEEWKSDTICTYVSEKIKVKKLIKELSKEENLEK